MGQVIHLLLSCLLIHKATPDSESDPDYAVAYDAAVAYLKANPFALNQQGDPYIYVQIKVDENRRSSINDEIQDIHLPTQVLKEIQDSYAKKDRLDIIDVKEDILDTAASAVKEETLATEEGYIEEDKLDAVTGYAKQDTLNTVAVYTKKDKMNKEAVVVAEDTLDTVADTVADDTLDSVASYVARDTLDTSFIDVQLPYNQPEPYVDIQVPQPYLYQDYTYHSQPKPYNTHQQNSYIHQANPYVHNEVPYVHEEVPYVDDEEPYVDDEKAYTHEMTSFVDVGATNARELASFSDVGMDSRTPKTRTEANYAAGENPYVDIQLTLRVPYDELESPTQHFADPALEFAYRTQQRQPRGHGPARGGQTYNSAQVYGDNQYEGALNDFASLQDLVNSVQWQRIK